MKKLRNPMTDAVEPWLQPADLDSAETAFVTKLPKVELHAHLNGCIRESTLFDLARERGVKLNNQHFAANHDPSFDHSMYNMRPRTLGDCFEVFAEITKCVDDLSSLARITMEALDDFTTHHVAYLELRSTPKILLVETGKEHVTTKRDYCDTVIRCMKQMESKEIMRYNSELAEGADFPRLPMICRFIVAIDRSQSLDDAYEHIDLAESLRAKFGDLVVGVDLGGNPAKNHFRNFRIAFENARQKGLKITLHCGEIACDEQESSERSRAYTEVKAILDFGPERLGHALLLPHSLGEYLLEKEIPVESCPTSNVMTLELAKNHSGSLLDGLKAHPQLESWILHRHPFSIGTDDPGVFNTNPTKEMLLLQRAFNLSLRRISEIPVQSMQYAFCNEETKQTVAKRIENRIHEMLNSLKN